MSRLRHLLATISALALGTGAGTFSHTAQAAVTINDIERDCERALREQTIEALEEFFIKYPAQKYRRKGIACYALALDAHRGFRPGEGRAGDNNDRPRTSGGYGD